MARYIGYVRPVEVCRRLGVTESVLRYLEKTGRFPKRQKIGTKAVGWLPEVVDPLIADFQKHCHEKDSVTA